MKSNATCLFCLVHPPQHVLPCGHSMCDECVYKFGAPSFSLEYRYCVSQCVFCHHDGELLIRLKPPTSGCRYIGIDGGGTRGVIPIEFLRVIQKVLGKECHLDDWFDIVAGTSSGKSRCTVQDFSNK